MPRPLESQWGGAFKYKTGQMGELNHKIIASFGFFVLFNGIANPSELS